MDHRDHLVCLAFLLCLSGSQAAGQQHHQTKNGGKSGKVHDFSLEDRGSPAEKCDNGMGAKKQDAVGWSCFPLPCGGEGRRVYFFPCNSVTRFASICTLACVTR